MKGKTTGVMVRLKPITKTMLDFQLAKVNKQRKKNMKADLTYGEFVALAIENFDLDEAINN
jgi:hypothetical protein